MPTNLTCAPKGSTRRLGRCRFRPQIEFLEDRWAPANVYWAVDADGVWNNAANWIDDQGRQRLPGFNDDVFLDREAGAYTVTFAQGSVTVNSLWASTSSLALQFGTLGLRSPSLIQSPLTLGGGRLTVDGPLFLLGDTTWTGGEFDGPGPVINLAYLTLSGSEAKFVRGTFTNYGIVTHTGTADLQVTAFGQFNNQAGALYDLQTDAGLSGEGAFTGHFNNLGWLRKSAGAGTSLVSAVNNQGGLLEVLTGTLGLGRAGKTHTGGFLWAHDGATLDLTSGSANDRFTGYYSGWGDGHVVLASGQLTLGGTGATFEFPGELFQWTGGRIEAGSPGLTNAGAMTLAGPSAKDLRGSLTNTGWFVHADAGTFVLPAFATFHNQQGGVYYLASDASILGEGAFNGRFNNVGLFLKSGGAGTSQFVTDFVNDGGTLHVESGELVFPRNVLQRGGQTFLAGGGLTVSLLDLQGGVLRGGGVITGNVRNAALVEVGGGENAAQLLVMGNYQQTATGSLEMELGAHAQGTWDILSVSGTATLGGRLTVRLLNGFQATAGDDFEVLTFSQRTGDFAMADLPDLGPSLFLDRVFDGDGLSLVTTQQA